MMPADSKNVYGNPELQRPKSTLWYGQNTTFLEFILHVAAQRCPIYFLNPYSTLNLARYLFSPLHLVPNLTELLPKSISPIQASELTTQKLHWRHLDYFINYPSQTPTAPLPHRPWPRWAPARALPPASSLTSPSSATRSFSNSTRGRRLFA